MMTDIRRDVYQELLIMKHYMDNHIKNVMTCSGFIDEKANWTLQDVVELFYEIRTGTETCVRNIKLGRSNMKDKR